MKKTRFRHLVALILMMCCTLGYAQTFKFKGLEYEVIDASKRYVEVVRGANTKTVKIPSTVTRGGVKYTVTSIGVGAFDDCYSLTSINIPSSVKSIGKSAFDSCGLTSINIPSSVTSIGWGAFALSSLTSINIPSSVKSIGGLAFWWCSSLTSINIPSSVKSIGEKAFDGCSSLTTITLPKHITNIDKLGIPEGVRIIRR